MRKINIPKLPDDEVVEVEIIKSQSTYNKAVCKKQTIAGITIPKGSIIIIDNWMDRGLYNANGSIQYIRGVYVNVLLRYLYLESVRNM